MLSVLLWYYNNVIKKLQKHIESPISGQEEGEKNEIYREKSGGQRNKKIL